MSLPKQSQTSAPSSPVNRKRQGPFGSVGAAHAKTHLLSIMDEVLASGAPVIITRRGKPQVQIAPLNPELPAPDIVGCMKGTFQIIGDVIGPEPDEWEATQ